MRAFKTSRVRGTPTPFWPPAFQAPYRSFRLCACTPTFFSFVPMSKSRSWPSALPSPKPWTACRMGRAMSDMSRSVSWPEAARRQLSQTPQRVGSRVSESAACAESAPPASHSTRIRCRQRRASAQKACIASVDWSSAFFCSTLIVPSGRLGM